MTADRELLRLRADEAAVKRRIADEPKDNEVALAMYAADLKRASFRVMEHQARRAPSDLVRVAVRGQACGQTTLSAPDGLYEFVRTHGRGA